MKNQKLPYREGTWFAFPLKTDGYAVGIVARMTGDGGVFGYFFGPKRHTIPQLEELSELSSAGACWRCQFGGLGFLNGEWSVIGQASHWNRLEWPLPPFIRYDEMDGKAWMSVYSDNLELVSDQPCDPDLRHKYPKNALSGYAAVQIVLTHILEPSLPDPVGLSANMRRD